MLRNKNLLVLIICSVLVSFTTPYFTKDQIKNKRSIGPYTMSFTMDNSTEMKTNDPIINKTFTQFAAQRKEQWDVFAYNNMN